MLGRAFGPGEVDALPPAHGPFPYRRPWHSGAILRRPFKHARQLGPAVFVAPMDLAVLVFDAREAMVLRDPLTWTGADGRRRTYIRCTSEVWRGLRASPRWSGTPELGRLRDVIASVHELGASLLCREVA